jgi:hypothetical protein
MSDKPRPAFCDSKAPGACATEEKLWFRIGGGRLRASPCSSLRRLVAVEVASEARTFLAVVNASSHQFAQADRTYAAERDNGICPWQKSFTHQPIYALHEHDFSLPGPANTRISYVPSCTTAL